MRDQPFSQQYTIQNGYHEVRYYGFGLSRSLEHIQPGLAKVSESLNKLGLPQPQVFSLDNPISDRGVFESVFPSLRHGVRYVGDAAVAGLHRATCDNYQWSVADDLRSIENSCRDICFEHRRQGPLTIFRPSRAWAPWAPYNSEAEIDTSQVAVLAIATPTRGYVLQVSFSSLGPVFPQFT